jgi:hypothetical protein
MKKRLPSVSGRIGKQGGEEGQELTLITESMAILTLQPSVLCAVANDVETQTATPTATGKLWILIPTDVLTMNMTGSTVPLILFRKICSRGLEHTLRLKHGIVRLTWIDSNHVCTKSVIS